MSENIDYAIIGAGPSGLAISNLLAKKGLEVHLFESHYSVGGCAGFYKRAGNQFDVGATTLSGLDFNGPMTKFFNLIGYNFEAKKLKESMCIHLNDERKLYHGDSPQKIINSLQANFKGINHEDFWFNTYNISKSAWSLLEKDITFPPRPKDILKVANTDTLSLLPSLATTLYRNLPAAYKENQQLLKFINEQVLISTQDNSSNIPHLIGSLGLSYPSDMYYPKGGIGGHHARLNEHFKFLGGQTYLKHSLKHFNKTDQGFELEFENGKIIHCKNLILTLPIWNAYELAGQDLKKIYKGITKVNRPKWSAISANFVVSTTRPITPLYHQVHLESSLFGNHANSIFVSFSDPADDTRTKKENQQTVTISTHVEIDCFPTKDSLDYKEQKDLIQNKLILQFKKAFEDYGIESIEHFELGTPSTFERYTKRFKGSVGGLAHNILRPVIFFPKNVTKVPGLYHIGDTTFPGQGIVGTTQGALNLYRLIFN